MANSLTFSASHARPVALRYRGTRWSWSLLVAVLFAVGFVELAGDRVVQAPAPAAPTDARVEGVFTGEFVDGVPVYRLPSLTVVADRDAEIARMYRDDSPLHATQTRG